MLIIKCQNWYPTGAVVAGAAAAGGAVVAAVVAIVMCHKNVISKLYRLHV